MIKKPLFALTFLFSFISAAPAYASHSWGNYHWARTTPAFNLNLGDNVLPDWEPYLATTSSDWSLSDAIDTTVVRGNTTGSRCRPTLGRVEVCNAKYGKNGWLGMAQIWVKGDHIVQAITKFNDTYFRTSKYNTPAWKNLVVCQEVGHTLGLDHQDENFNNPPLGTCLDYSYDPIPNQHPNQHDYDQLALIYAHLDSSSTLSQSKSRSRGLAQTETGNNTASLGRLVKKNNKAAVYELKKAYDEIIITFIEEP